MQGLIAFIFGIWNGFRQYIANAIGSLLQWSATVLDYFFAYLLDLLPDSWADYWNAFQGQLENLFEWLDVISYFIPIYGMLTFILGVYSAVASIRLFRWGLALIPRVFTGVG